MNNLYNEDYFERGCSTGLSCYSNYRWIPELTIPMCAEMIAHLNIDESKTVLDFGCAKGYSVKAFRLLYRNAYGVDISSYATSSAPSEVLPYIHLINPGDDIPLINNTAYDWTIAKDVLEHVDYTDIKSVLSKIRAATKNLFVIVPLGKDGKYVVPAYDLDVTHRIREPLEWWENTVKECGFNVQESTYSVKHIKNNWASWEFGNGFLVLS